MPQEIDRERQRVFGILPCLDDQRQGGDTATELDSDRREMASRRTLS